MNKSRGITLIALVVTVVVLLIIAAISIGVLTGENGIINQAKKGKEDTEIGEEKEIVNETYTLAANENEYGDVEEDILQEILDERTGENKTTVDKVGDIIFVTFNETERTYAVDDNGQVFMQEGLEEAIIMRDFITKASIDRKLVEKIIFTNSKEGPTNIEIYDISEEQNDTVRMWILDEDDNGQYEVYIGANYRIIANENMTDFFKNFLNCVSIEGLQYLDTSRTTIMDGMFWGCQNLENLDVSNFNTSKVRSISGMFQDCLGLSKLDLSNFDTSNVTDMSRLFSFSRNLLEIDISGFDFSQVTSYNQMFYSVPAKAKIYVKYQSDKEWITNNPTTSATIEIKN